MVGVNSGVDVGNPPFTQPNSGIIVGPDPAGCANQQDQKTDQPGHEAFHIKSAYCHSEGGKPLARNTISSLTA